MLKSSKNILLFTLLAVVGALVGADLDQRLDTQKTPVFGAVDRYAVSEEGGLIALDVRGEKGNHVALVSSSSGKLKRKALSPALDLATHSMRFSGNGKVIVLRWLRQINVYSVRGKLLGTFETPDQFTGMALNDKGTRLATMARGSNQIRVFDLKTGEAVGEIDAPKKGPFCLTPKGDTLIFAGDTSLFFLQLKSGKLKEVRTKMNLQSVRLLDRGKLLAVADDKGRLEFRKSSNGKKVGKVFTHSSPAWLEAHTKKARLFATGCKNEGAAFTIHLWERKTGKLMEDFVGIAPTFSQDDKVIAYTDQARVRHELVAKDLEDGKELFRIKRGEGERAPFLITVHNSKKNLGVWTAEFGLHCWENVRFRKVPRPQDGT